jgi:uncharacterized protein (TIGR02145 family)
LGAATRARSDVNAEFQNLGHGREKGVMGRDINTPNVIPILMCLAMLPVANAALGDDETAVGDPSDLDAGPETVTDVDGNVYHTVTIGSQVWMVENLRVAHYRDGAAIPRVSDSEQWSDLTAGAYCLPEHDPSVQKDTYGLLYNFHAIRDRRGLCPRDWHVPTAEEWRTLIARLGGAEVAGGVMKDISSGLWRVPVPGATNESGFSAVPAGGRGRFGRAAEAGYYATWWSATPAEASYAWHWGLYPDRNVIRFNPGHQSSGFSVRCLRD